MIELASEGSVAAFAGADAYGIFDMENKDLPVAHLAGLGDFLNHLDDLLNHFVWYNDFQLCLWDKVNLVLAAPVELGVALLPAESLDLTDGHALDSDFAQCIAHVIEAKRFYNGGHELNSLNLHSKKRWCVC